MATAQHYEVIVIGGGHAGTEASLAAARMSAPEDESSVVVLSAKTGAGLDLLRQHLKQAMGYEAGGEHQFMARRRHLEALEDARGFLLKGQAQLRDMGAGELLADDLRQCHKALGQITGAMSSDALLGEIFSSFCIGK